MGPRPVPSSASRVRGQRFSERLDLAAEEPVGEFSLVDDLQEDAPEIDTEDAASDR